METKSTNVLRLPEEWKLKSIGETCDLVTGFPFKSVLYDEAVGIKVLRGENVSVGFLRWDTEKRWKHSTKGLEKYFLQKNDVVIGMDGSKVGKNRAQIQTSDLPLILAQRVARLRATGELNQVFLAEIILHRNFEKYVESVHTGTSIPHISGDQIKTFMISIPPPEEQKEIAEVLSCLTAKIRSNQLMNCTLEAIGQAIFKRWFVDFEFPNQEGKPYKSTGGKIESTDFGELPKEWTMKPFSEVIAVNPTRKIEKGVIGKKVEMADLKPWQLWIESFAFENYKSGSRFQNGDILLARITPCLENGKTGFVSFLDKNEIAFGSTEFIVLGPKAIQSSYFILYLAISNNLRASAILSMTGSSGRQRVPNDFFDDFMIAVPPDDLLLIFDSLVAPMFAEITNNVKESGYLEEIRDLLLPRLMSGKIRVPIDKEKTEAT
jgi:type I restriction enzyme S subunit